MDVHSVYVEFKYLFQARQEADDQYEGANISDSNMSESSQELVLRLSRDDISLQRENETIEDRARLHYLAQEANYVDAKVLSHEICFDARTIDGMMSNALAHQTEH